MRAASPRHRSHLVGWPRQTAQLLSDRPIGSSLKEPQARTRRIFQAESLDAITASVTARFYLNLVYCFTEKL